MARRIVVEHRDGRRVSVEEARFDDASANPFNHGGRMVEDTGAVWVEAARPSDEHRSLKEEGFKPVMQIDGDGHEAPLPKRGR